MRKPSRTRDMIGAVLLLLVGWLYLTGATDPAHAAGESDVAVEVVGTATPTVVEAGDFTT